MNLDPNQILRAADEMHGLRASVPAEAEKLYGIMRSHGIDINPRNIAWCSAGLGAAVVSAGFNIPSNPAYAPNWEKWGKAVPKDKMKSGDVIYTTEAVKDADGNAIPGKREAGHAAIYAGMTRKFNNKTYALVEASNTTDYNEDKMPLHRNAQGKMVNAEGYERTQYGMQNLEWLEVDENFFARRSLQADQKSKNWISPKAKAFSALFKDNYVPGAGRYPAAGGTEIASPSISPKVEPEASPISDTTPEASSTPKTRGASVSQASESAPPATTISEANGEKPATPAPAPEKKVTADQIASHNYGQTWAQ
jgi:hypothetical protein